MDLISLKRFRTSSHSTNEAYKMIRTNIQFCGAEIKTVGITSCSPSEGKSTIAVNIAMSLAENGKKVIMIDGDLRKSVLVGRYKLSKSVKGLSHFLSGISPENEIIVKTDINGLDLIFSGPNPPNPSELLSGERFSLLVRKLSARYDYVIIDTPPLGSVIDAAVISKVCDGMILAIKQKAVSYKYALRIKQQLERAGAKFLGAVLTQVKSGHLDYYGDQYGKYYGN